MTPQQPDRDTDPALSALLDSAYAQRVDVEVAARHLWVIHRAAGSLRVQGRRTRKALVSVLAGGMLFMSSGGAVAASSDALPGDMLYSVKRGVEQARIVLSVSREGDARLHLALAERRMSEARAAAAKRPQVVAELVEEALESIDTAERTGGTVVAMEVQEARRETTQQLDVLVAVLDESAAARIEPRKIAPAPPQADLVPSPSTGPSAPPSDAAPSEGTATLASEPSSSPSAAASTTSPSPSSSPSASSSPTASTSPSSSPSPSPSSSPSATASPSSSPSATATASPAEPTPTSSPTRKYESVEPSEAPTGTEPSAAPTS